MPVERHPNRSNQMKNQTLTMAVSVAIALLAGVGIRDSSAQAPATFKRVELQRQDIDQGREAVLARAEFQPAGAVPKHTHPGPEVGYLLEGEVTLEVEGKPPMVLKPGDSFFIAGNTVHQAKNTGKGGAKILSTYVVEKGKPLASPAK
jgi:quercetin dioxygenase-like cupin family protein